MTGDLGWASGGRFEPMRLLLDPYAPWAEPLSAPEGVNDLGPDGAPDKILLGALGPLVDKEPPAPRAEGPASIRPLGRAGGREAAVTLSVAAFTRHPRVPEDLQGSYAGIAYRVQDLVGLGVTTVVLRHVLLSGRGTDARPAPLSFFAPDPSLATEAPEVAGSVAARAAAELQAAILSLRTAGLRVLMEVSFCRTGEGDDERSRCCSWRGIDHSLYYRGGGVLNLGNPVVRQLMVDSARHWRDRFGVDGLLVSAPEPLCMSEEGIVQVRSRVPLLATCERDQIHSAPCRMLLLLPRHLCRSRTW